MHLVTNTLSNTCVRGLQNGAVEKAPVPSVWDPYVGCFRNWVGNWVLEATSRPKVVNSSIGSTWLRVVAQASLSALCGCRP